MNTTTPTNLSVIRCDDGDLTTFVLRGSIDEHADISALNERPKPTLVLDLKGVARINSIGVKLWIEMLNSIPETTDIYFSDCSIAIVGQINMIKNFSGRAKILSFYAPYYCENCDIEYKSLFEMDRDFASPPYKAPATQCTRCQGKLQLDDIEEDYMQIVATAKKAGERE